MAPLLHRAAIRNPSGIAGTAYDVWVAIIRVLMDGCGFTLASQFTLGCLINSEHRRRCDPLHNGAIICTSACAPQTTPRLVVVGPAEGLLS